MTPVIQLESVGKSFGDLVLYEGLNLSLGEGEHAALIARNGAGKTTLLNIISGKISPDSGKVTFRSGISVGFLEQEPLLDGNSTILETLYRSGGETGETVRLYENAIATGNREQTAELSARMDELGAWDYEHRAHTILSRLKITSIDRKTGLLSGGERKRVALAAILIEDPDLLILDEPTNHLDLEMVEWLEEFLLKRGKSLLLVTHDRYFLDRICDSIYEIDQKNIYKYAGGYSDYLIRHEERIAQFDAGTDKARNLFRRELEWMRRMPQARGTKAKYRKDAFYEVKDRASAGRDDRSVKINAGTQRLGTKIFEIKGASKRFGDKVILSDFSYNFTRGEKLAIVGKNGTGKSTFLNMLTGAIPVDSGTVDIGESVRFGYYRQSGMEFDPSMKVIDVARDVAEVVTLGDGKSVTASQFLNNFLFTPESQYNYVSKLSGGERRRLYLATILMRSPNFLILDEPTNDLDIITLNILEEYLSGFQGCIIIVSHDRYFTDKIAQHILVFEGEGKISDFPGNYTEYRNSTYKDNNEEIEKNAPAAVAEQCNKPVRNERPRKMTFKESREFESLGTEIEDLEREKRDMEELLSSGKLTGNELVSVSVKMGDIIALIDEKSLRWLELSEL